MVGLLLSTGAAVAQPAGVPGSASEQAIAAFEAGRTLLVNHRAAEACAQFARALELEPGDVGVMLNLGLCHEELDKLATALAWFRRALARASELKLVESTHAATSKIATLSGAVATTRLVLSSPAAVATVTVDGAAVADRDLLRVELDAGRHVIEVTVAGAVVARREADAVDGVATSVVLDVPPARGQRAPADQPERSADRVEGDGAHAQRRRAYLVGAIGGGLVLGSVALGLVGRHAVGATEHPDVQERWHAVVMYGGTSMFVLGGVALGWATWTYLHAPSAWGDRTVVAPVVGARSVGVGVQGAF